MIIGYPNSFAYINMENFFSNFLKEINENIEIVISNETTKDIFEKGIQVSIDELCLPAKIFLGHVEHLIEQGIDILLLPRLTSMNTKKYSCPKVIGMVDLVKNLFKNTKILSPELNLYDSYNNKQRFLFDLANDIKKYNINIKKIINKYSNLPFKNIQKNSLCKNSILLIAHEYILFDEYLINDIKNVIIDNNYFPVNVYEVYIPQFYNYNLLKPFFWHTADEIINKYLYILENNKLEGIIYFMSFGCGIDSILEDIIKRISNKNKIPYLCITLDEHTGYGGYITRVEAFLDMIEWRKKINENSVPTHGESIYNC